MKQTILIFPRINNKIESVRKKYRKRYGYDYVEPHISVIYPFDNSKDIDKHISESVDSIEPIHARMDRLQKSAKEYWLYLALSKGKGELVALHRKLLSGPLRNAANPDMPKYIPHMSLGTFPSKKEIDEAVVELKDKGLKSEFTVESIYLVSINSKGEKVKQVEYKLGLGGLR